MGSIGTEFTAPAAFNAGHGYEPAVERMRTLLKNFTFFPDSITDEAVQLRYQTSTRAGHQSTFEKLFPGSREQKMKALITPDEQNGRATDRKRWGQYENISEVAVPSTKKK